MNILQLLLPTVPFGQPYSTNISIDPNSLPSGGLLTTGSSQIKSFTVTIPTNLPPGIGYTVGGYSLSQLNVTVNSTGPYTLNGSPNNTLSGNSYVIPVSIVGGFIVPPTITLTGVCNTTGLYTGNQFIITANTTAGGSVDLYGNATIPTASTYSSTQTYTLTCIQQINLSNLTVDQGDFVTQLQTALANKQSWAGNLTTETSETIIELVATIAAFDSTRVIRATENAFPQLAQNDAAILAGAILSGVRLARKLPAQALVNLSNTASTSITILPYTQFSGAGAQWFNTQTITIPALGSIANVALYEGTINITYGTGTGKPNQMWISNEDSFTISDQDVVIKVNGTVLEKTFGGLWNAAGTSAYGEFTLKDGRAIAQFGTASYGYSPATSDTIAIQYCVTSGSLGNTLSTIGSSVVTVALVGAASQAVPYPTISGTFVTNPSGGADELPASTYKTISAGSFGTYGSAVTKPQLQSIAKNYPGIADVIVKVQRDIDPSSLYLMNTAQVSLLPTGGVTWTQAQTSAYFNYLNQNTMYSTQYVLITPSAIPVVVAANVYVINTVQSLAAIQETLTNAITAYLSPRTGILGLNMYLSDLDTLIKNAAPGVVDYVDIVYPTADMLVTAPSTPPILYALNPTTPTAGVSALTTGAYAYSVGVSAVSPVFTGNTFTVGAGGASLSSAQSGYFVEITYSGSASPIALPSPGGNSGVSYTIYNQNTLSSTITTASGAIILSGVSSTSIGVAPNTEVYLVSDGTNWLATVGTYNLDVGAPSSWVYPVYGTSLANGTQYIDLTWPITTGQSYTVYGRTATLSNTIGVLATISASQVASLVAAGVTPGPSTSTSGSPIVIATPFWVSNIGRLSFRDNGMTPVAPIPSLTGITNVGVRYNSLATTGLPTGISSNPYINVYYTSR